MNQNNKKHKEQSLKSKLDVVYSSFFVVSSNGVDWEGKTQEGSGFCTENYFRKKEIK